METKDYAKGDRDTLKALWKERLKNVLGVVSMGY